MRVQMPTLGGGWKAPVVQSFPDLPDSDGEGQGGALLQKAIRLGPPLRHTVGLEPHRAPAPVADPLRQALKPRDLAACEGLNRGAGPPSDLGPMCSKNLFGLP